MLAWAGLGQHVAARPAQFCPQASVVRGTRHADDVHRMCHADGHRIKDPPLGFDGDLLAR